jgi:hypothetical protein
MEGEKLVAVLLPESLVGRVERQWSAMHADPAVAAIRPRKTSTAAVRVALHLVLERLELAERQAAEAAPK